MPVTDDGVRYRVIHNRVAVPVEVPEPPGEILLGADEDPPEGYVISGKGGWTLVEILDADDLVIAAGEADCSRLDNYNRKRGRDIALGRALVRAKAHALLDDRRNDDVPF